MSEKMKSQKSDKEPSKSSSSDNKSESFSSELSESSAESIKILLEESNQKPNFLFKTGVLFFIYLLCLTIMSIFVRFDVVRARFWFRAMRAGVLGWIALGLACAIKLLLSFGGQKLRIIMTPAYVLDCLLSMIAFLGIYFFSEDYTRGEYRRHLHEYMILGSWILTLSITGFLIATMIATRKGYNFFIAFAFMELMTILGIIMAIFLWNTGNITTSRYIGLSVFLTVFNLYFSLNSFLCVKYRGKKFFEKDQVYNFFCYWTDIITWFWLDIFSNTKVMKKRAKKKRRKEKKARKAAREEAKKKKRRPTKKSAKQDPDQADLEVELKSDEEQIGEDIEIGARA